MAFTNYELKEINCKIVYFGPSGSGKTTNLRSIYKNTSAELRAGLIEFEEQSGPTRFFDFLPISMGRVKDFHLKLHLYTLPTQSLYESVASVILKGIDGFVFVADSRIEAMAENILSMNETKKLLTKEGFSIADLPRVIQYNKRDLEDIVSVDILRQELNTVGSYDHEAIATQSTGIMETVESMAKIVLKKLAT